MYKYESSLVKRKGFSGRWIDIDLRELPIARLFDEYQTVFLILSHQTLPSLVSLDLKDVDWLIAKYDDALTVAQWLVTIGNQSLPTRDYIPQSKTATVFYNDLYSAGYKVEITHRLEPFESKTSDDEKDDIRLTRYGTDYRDVYNHCLITVNGLIHRTDYDKDGVYVRYGARSSRVANEHHLGGISFKNIGKLDFIKINPDDVYSRPETPLYSTAMIQLPEDIGSRIPLLVIGGYLHILDDSYAVTSERSIRVSLDRIPYIDRFYASRKLMSLRSIEDLCERDSRNEDHFLYADLIKDDVIRTYLTLDNSFIVLLEADNLFVEKHNLEDPHLPGRYYAYQKPQWPLMTELGRMPAYVADREATGTWVISVYDNLFENMRYRSHEYEGELSLDGARESSKPYHYAPGFLLEIGSDVTT